MRSSPVGPLLAHVLFSKYCLRLPLNRQSAAYAREGIELDVSTLADWVGACACAATLRPLVEPIRAHNSIARPRMSAVDVRVTPDNMGVCAGAAGWGPPFSLSQNRITRPVAAANGGLFS